MLLIQELGNIVFNDASLLHDDDSISFVGEVDSVGHKHDCLAFFMQVRFEAVIEDVLADIRVKSTQTVVHQVYVRISVQSSSN